MFQSSTRPQPDVVRTGRSWPGGGLGADGLFVYERIKAEGPQCAVSCQLVLSRFHDYISLFIAPVYEFQWLIQVEDAQKQMETERREHQAENEAWESQKQVLR